MRISTDNLMLTAIVALAFAATAVVVVDQLSDDRREAVGRSFQAAVGGLGLGPHADLAHCAWQFDPRLADDDDAGLDALPGSHDDNPWHATALFSFDPTVSNGLD